MGFERGGGVKVWVSPLTCIVALTTLSHLPCECVMNLAVFYPPSGLGSMVESSTSANKVEVMINRARKLKFGTQYTGRCVGLSRAAHALSERIAIIR